MCRLLQSPASFVMTGSRSLFWVPMLKSDETPYMHEGVYLHLALVWSQHERPWHPSWAPGSLSHSWPNLNQPFKPAVGCTVHPVSRCGRGAPNVPESKADRGRSLVELLDPWGLSAVLLGEEELPQGSLPPQCGGTVPLNGLLFLGPHCICSLPLLIYVVVLK